MRTYRALAALVLAGMLFHGCGGAPPALPAPDAPAPADGPLTEKPAGATDWAVPAPENGGPIRVAFVPNNPSDFWKIAEAGTKKAADELGVEVLFRMPSAGTAEQQMQIVQDMITTGVSGIAISPSDPTNQTEMLNEAAAKVNLVTQDSDAPESDRLCYVGTDNRAAGREAGKLIKAALPAGGKLMVFVGTMDAQNAQDRLAGVKEELGDGPYEILDVRTDDGDRAKAVANAEDALVTTPDLGGLVGLWSYNGPALINALESVGKVGQVQIVCFDEEDETLQGVADGTVYGTIVQQPFEFGYQSVVLLAKLAKGEANAVPESEQIIVPTLSVTKENVDEFRARLKEVLGR